MEGPHFGGLSQFNALHSNNPTFNHLHNGHIITREISRSASGFFLNYAFFPNIIITGASLGPSSFAWRLDDVTIAEAASLWRHPLQGRTGPEARTAPFVVSRALGQGEPGHKLSHLGTRSSATWRPDIRLDIGGDLLLSAWAAANRLGAAPSVRTQVRHSWGLHIGRLEGRGRFGPKAYITRMFWGGLGWG